jgi:hypothetical protein
LQFGQRLFILLWQDGNLKSLLIKNQHHHSIERPDVL